MSTSLPLSGCTLSRSSRLALTKAGFSSRESVLQLRPTQLAHELGVTPQAALAIIQELQQPGRVERLDGLTNVAVGEEEKKEQTTSQSSPTPPTATTTTKSTITPAARIETNQFGENALELMRRRALLRPIQTGCEEFDKMMGSGVPIGQITEFCGVPGCGKTQLCIQLCCGVQLPKSLGGGWDNGEAVYIDTEGSFLPKRAQTIAQGMLAFMNRRIQRFQQKGGKTPVYNLPSVETMLQRIWVFRAYDHIEQLATIKSLSAFLKAHPQVHLVVIDSVAFHFRRGFQDAGLRSRILCGMAQELLYLANQHQLAIVVTNQVATRFDGVVQGGGVGHGTAALSPALGESWSHSCTNRIMLDYEGGQRIARLLKSPSLKSTQVVYQITEQGIASPSPPPPPIIDSAMNTPTPSGQSFAQQGQQPLQPQPHQPYQSTTVPSQHRPTHPSAQAKPTQSTQATNYVAGDKRRFQP